MWDALGKQAGLPSACLWGGRWRKDVEAAAYLFINDRAAACKERIRTLPRCGLRDVQGQDRVRRAERHRAGGNRPRSDRRPGAARSMSTAPGRPAPRGGSWRSCARSIRPMSSSRWSSTTSPAIALLRRSTPIPIASTRAPIRSPTSATSSAPGAADVVLLDPHEAGGLWQTIKAAAHLRSGRHSGDAAFRCASCPVARRPTSTSPHPSPTCRSPSTRSAPISAATSRPPARLLSGSLRRCRTAPGLGVEVDRGLVRAISPSTGIAGAYLDSARPDWFPVKPRLSCFHESGSSSSWIAALTANRSHFAGK